MPLLGWLAAPFAHQEQLAGRAHLMDSLRGQAQGRSARPSALGRSALTPWPLCGDELARPDVNASSPRAASEVQARAARNLRLLDPNREAEADTEPE